MIDKTCGDQFGFATPDYDSSAGTTEYRSPWPWMASLGYHDVRICITTQNCDCYTHNVKLDEKY